MDHPEITSLRQQIESIDEQMIRLLAERQEKVRTIGTIKKAETLPIYDPKRELSLRQKRRELCKKFQLDPLRVEVIFEQILTLSKDTQRSLQSKTLDLPTDHPVRIGVMGGVGSFSEEAGVLFAKNHHIDDYEMEYPISSENVLKQLDSQKIDIGIFPIENSTAGLVLESIIAASQYTFDIEEIFNLNVRHCLHVLPGVRKEDITKIMSHPQALKQCKGYLQKEFPDAELIEATDTAEGARVLEQSPDEKQLAVIAPKKAGELYHLETLEEGIQDLQENFTRFIAAKKSSSFSQ